MDVSSLCRVPFLEPLDVLLEGDDLTTLSVTAVGQTVVQGHNGTIDLVLLRGRQGHVIDVFKIEN